MTYDPSKASFPTNGSDLSAQGTRMVEITPHDTNQLASYAKALRIHIPADTESPTIAVVPMHAASDDDVVTLPLPTGSTDIVHIEDLAVRVVKATNTTEGLTIHGYL